MCRILTKAVTCREGWLDTARFDQPQHRDAHRQDCRLCVLRKLQRLSRALETERAQRFAERRIGLGKRIAADRKVLSERLSHPDLLRSLAGKDECDHRM